MGNGLASSGDTQTPTSSAAGQAQWLTDTLCALKTLGVQATGWYGLYDSASWWEAAPLNYSGAKLAWTGYFGLWPETGSSGKQAWTSFLGYPGNCPSSTLPPAPVLAVNPDASYYTTGNPATITYGAADVTLLTLSQPPTGGIYSCNSANRHIPLDDPAGLVRVNHDYGGQRSQQETVTLNGSNTDVAGNTSHQPISNSAYTVLNVQPSPLFGGAVNVNYPAQLCNFAQSPSCVITACQGDYLELFGQGFDPRGGNTVNFVAGANSLWLSIGDNWGYWDGSRIQIKRTDPHQSFLRAWDLEIRYLDAGSAGPVVGVFHQHRQRLELPMDAVRMTMKAIFHASTIFAAVWVVCPAAAQNLSGTVTAADTGAPLTGVTVTAILRPASFSQVPAIYRSAVDSSGNYAITAPPGQYLLCARPQLQSLYLDPCQWGRPVSATVGATAVPVPFSLQKGVRFIVRVHDPNQLLPQAEAVPGAAVSASVASASVSQLLLPVVYGDGLVRDYGTVVPTNVPMSVTISSATVVLADGTGTALAPTAVTFEALQSDLGSAPGAPPGRHPSSRLCSPLRTRK
jgi:hypothetical protein